MEMEESEMGAEPEFYKKIAPWLLECDFAKKVAALQAFTVPERGEKLHILCVGDAGSGKSDLMEYLTDIVPCSTYVGKRTTYPGLVDEIGNCDTGILCLHPKTKIVVNNSLQTIEEVYNQKIINSKVVTYENFIIKNGVFTKVLKKRYCGKILCLNFESGFSIKLTPNHLLINGNTLDWEEAQNLSIGDSIIAPLKIPSVRTPINLLDVVSDDWKIILNKKQKLKLRALKKNHKFKIQTRFLELKRDYGIRIGDFKNLTKKLGIYEEIKREKFKFFHIKKATTINTSKINVDLAYLIGFTYGDGSRNKKGIYSITQSLVHKKIIDNLKLKYLRVFNKQPSIFEYECNSKSIPTKNKHIILLTNKPFSHICDYFIKNNLKNILNLPNDVLASFFSGLIDADGCISIRKQHNNYTHLQISFYATNNMEEARTISLALRRFDCYSKIKRKSEKLLSLEINNRTDTNQLLKCIKGHCVKYKESPNKKNINSGRSDILPSEPIAKILDAVYKKINTSILVRRGLASTFNYYRKKTLKPHRNTIHKIIKVLSDVMDHEAKLNLLALCNRDYFLDQIKSIEQEFYEGYVYDLTVPITNNFMAEGIIVHNCVEEFDKVPKYIRDSLLEMMQSQKVKVTMKNFSGFITARTNIFAVCNPIGSKVSDSLPIHAQLTFSKEIPLLTRFHLIIPFKSLSGKMYGDIAVSQNYDATQAVVDKKNLLRYLMMVRSKFSEVFLTDEMSRKVGNYIAELEQISRMKDIITPRTIDGFKSALKARARMNFRDQPVENDFKYVKQIFDRIYFPEGFK